MASPYSSISSATGGPPHSPAATSQSTSSHREIYENERTRIQQSCFSRADADGQLLECYITHVRVIEDAVHPSAPPPPNYQPGPDARKNRVIIVAVRKSGRVRLHKARENNTGSFSIGKSWYLDDLTHIENDPGCTGFTATIGKPYYWQTRTSREKEAFVASLFRIFKKYTGGKSPVLVGFDSITSLSGEGRPSTGNSDIFQGEQLNGHSHSPAVTPTIPTPASHAEHSRQLSSVSSHGSRPSITTETEPGRPELQTRLSDTLANPRMQRRPTNESTRQPISPVVYESKHSFPETELRPEEQSIAPPPEPAADTVTGSNGFLHQPNQQKSSGGLPTSPRGVQRGGLPTSPKTSQMQPIQTNLDPQRGPTPQAISPQATSPQAPSPQATTPHGPAALPSTSAPIISLPQGPRLGLANKGSSKDIAARFKLAADAYAAGGALSKGNNKTRGIPSPTPPVSAAAVAAAIPSEADRVRDLKSENTNTLKVGVSISKEDLLRGKMSGHQDSIPEKSSRRPESPAMQNLPDSKKASISSASEGPSERAASRQDSRPIPSIDISGTPDSTAIRQELFRDAAPTVSKTVILDVPDKDEGETTGATEEKPLGKSSLLSARHKRRRSAASNSARSKYMTQIDFTNMTVDIDAVLEEFGWDGRNMKIDALESEVRQELAKVESGNIWIATDDENKAANTTKIEELAQQLDETLAQCDELDGLLTLYAVELMSLQDDIAYIENQSQGLQVQTANQKTLQKELEVLLQTVSISPEEIETLQNSKVQAEHLPDIESSLCVLYKAIITIDPTVGTAAGAKPTPAESDLEDIALGEAGMGKMMALKDKKDKYVDDSRMFARRLIEYMKIKYRQDLMTLVKPLDGSAPVGRGRSAGRPKALTHIDVYYSLYKFAGLILFTRDIDRSSYLTLVREYAVAVKDQFTEEIGNNIWGWKGIMRKPTAEDQEILFTHAEKESESSSVRGLGVMRSATRAKPFRSQNNDTSARATAERAQDGKLLGSECFAGFLDDIIPLVAAEQNFLSEFFHMSSNSASNYLEFVQSGHPDDRRPSDINRRRVPEQDKQVAKRLYETMTDVFGFLVAEMQSFVAVITSNDPLQGVGVVYAIEKKLSLFREGTNQEFLVKCLLKLSENMKSAFIAFLKEQVRAIEATKVKSKKKRTVLDFIKSFPQFSAKIEDQLPPEQLTDESLEVRELVNNGYGILNRAMFEAMQAIAKQSSSGGAQTVDPEDKEALHYHIMIIQNMDYYTEALDVRNNSVLQDSKQKAEEEYKEHMALYVSAAIRKHLEKTLDFVEGVEALEQTSTPEEILGKKGFTKLKFKEILNDNQKEISGSHVRDGIKQLVKRVTKQFGDEGHLDPLSVRVLKEAENEYLRLVNRMNSLLQGTYRDQGLEMPLKREDVIAAFAKQMSAK
ncbi:hypothetical protein TWF173_001226 [Orbilia oligospora]|uniref:Exocyst complex component Sec3 PIP2-binding N-terminal domain-containing protein n=1 Tax=Orbilia oligospora TaxID=2813651 RepID=A0A7C8VMN6_ORBOL|nr:hypothetical protein TWF970_004332 [Orbilia oligospora]KAF3308473.1 hypothetical protein TWF173_001226 [Orbilia oligospora]